MALYGDESAIARTAKELTVTYAKHDSGSSAGYLLDHSAGFYGFGPHGRLRLLINHDAERVSIVHDVKLLLGEKP